MGSKITILGPGLLGASLGKAVRERGLFETIHSWSRQLQSRKKCQQQPWCDSVLETAAEAIDQADLVILCLPVQVIPSLLQELSGVFSPGTIISDVGSTKTNICRTAAECLPEAVQFVGSHPMAGSQKSGMENAKADLFEGQPCILTPTEGTSPRALEVIREFWQNLGMRVSEIPPEDHDRIVAAISHLPHILASCLCENLGGKNPEWKEFAGKGLRDSTRVAAGDPEMWRQIVEENTGSILEMVESFQMTLQQFVQAMQNKDFLQVEKLLAQGKSFRESLE